MRDPLMAANSFSLLLLLLFTITTHHHLISAARPTSSLPLLPPGLQEQQQFSNIMDALIGTGDFANWASILSATTDPSTLPFTTTFFIPTNEALSNFSNPNPSTITAATPDFDPFIFAYHIVPQRLTFSELQHFRLNSRLPTLLPNKSIIITNNSPSNFTIDASRITHPDFYLTAAVSVHGIGGLLDYGTYGNEPKSQLPDKSPESATSRPPLPPLPPPPPMTVTGEIVGIARSAALMTNNSTKMYRILWLFAFLL